MKFKAAGLLALIMTVAVMAQPSDESRIAHPSTRYCGFSLMAQTSSFHCS
jgi:hypothetical protein